MRRLAALVALTMGLLAPPAAAGADTPAPVVTLIGDSTMLAMRAPAQAIVSARFPMRFEAASCRRLIVKSCGRTFQPPNTLDVMRSLDGRLGEVLVIMAGYDDVGITEAITTIMGEARRQGVRRVLWLTFKTGVIYTGPGGVSNDATFVRNNADLAAAQPAWPELRVLDWDGHAIGHPEWFARDGIHLTTAGSLALAEFIADAIAVEPLGRTTRPRPYVV